MVQRSRSSWQRCIRNQFGALRLTNRCYRFLFDDVAHHPGARDVIAVADAMREQLATGQNHSAARTFIDFWSGTGAWDSLPDGKRAPIATRMPAVLQQFDALFHEPLQRAQLALLRMPMFLISGAQTVNVARAIVEMLRLTLPCAQYEVCRQWGTWDRSRMRPRSTSAWLNSCRCRIEITTTTILGTRGRCANCLLRSVERERAGG